MRDILGGEDNITKLLEEDDKYCTRWQQISFKDAPSAANKYLFMKQKNAHQPQSNNKKHSDMDTTTARDN